MMDGVEFRREDGVRRGIVLSRELAHERGGANPTGGAEHKLFRMLAVRTELHIQEGGQGELTLVNRARSARGAAGNLEPGRGSVRADQTIPSQTRGTGIGSIEPERTIEEQGVEIWAGGPLESRGQHRRLVTGGRRN